MDEEIDVSVAVERLKSAGRDASKQLPALLKLGDWYLKSAKTTSLADSFTKANALYNAAFVRSRLVNKSEDDLQDDDRILRRIVQTYREFLCAFASDEKIRSDEIRDEINSHKEFLAHERGSFKKRLDEIDSGINANDELTELDNENHAEKMYDVFHDIQEMYTRLVSMLVKECESRLGKPPCDYAIIALGSVARMEATPFSDLEFAILYSDRPNVGDAVKYFQILTHFLHLKVINFGETILPSLGIEQLNHLESSDPSDNWFYDSETPRGISFDGAMPWASKTPLGRMATKDKPALELIKTPEEMAKIQDEEFAVNEGYHLADIMSRAALLYGEQALLDEYNDRVAEKLSAKSCALRMRYFKIPEEVDLRDEGIAEKKENFRSGFLYPSKELKQKYDKLKAECQDAKSPSRDDEPLMTVGLVRGFNLMLRDIETYSPFYSYLGDYCAEGGLFDAKKQFYRLISLLLSDLGIIFEIRSPSPWHVISALRSRGIIDDSETVNLKLCLSIANEIRLKTYFANRGQKEMFSPLSQSEYTSEEPIHAPIFRDFNEDNLVQLLSTSHILFKRCSEFGRKYIEQGEIDVGIIQNPSVSSSKATLLGYLYFRLQNFHKALEWMTSESEDSPDYVHSLSGQGIIHYHRGDYEKSIELFEAALELHSQTGETSKLNVFSCINNMAVMLQHLGQHERARVVVEEGVDKYFDIKGDIITIELSHLMQTFGVIHSRAGNTKKALEAFQLVEQMHNSITKVPDKDVIYNNMSIAISLGELGEHLESLEHVKRALQLSRKVFGERDLSSVMAKVYIYAGYVYSRCQLEDEALSFFKRSMEMFQLIFPDRSSPEKIDCLIYMGKLYCQKKQTREAVETLESAEKEARSLFHGKPNVKVPTVLLNLAMAIDRANKSGAEKSLAYLREAKEIMDGILGPNHVHPLTSSVHHFMATVYHDLGDFTTALQCFQDALKMKSVIFGNNVNGTMAALCSKIASILEKLGMSNEAIKYYSKAVEIYRKISVNKSTCPGFVSSLYRLSLIYEVLEEPDETIKYLEEARNVAKVFGYKDANMLSVLMKLSEKYKAIGAVAQNETCFQELKDIAKSLTDVDSLPLFSQLLIKVLKNRDEESNVN